MDNLNLISNYDRACVESNEIDKLIVETSYASTKHNYYSIKLNLIKTKRTKRL